MNYMLPLYLDYLERPHIYEMIYLKERGVRDGGKLGKISKAKHAAKLKLQAAQKVTSDADLTRRVKDIKALGKKTVELTKKTSKKLKPTPVATKKGGVKATALLKTAKGVGGKAAMVAGGAAAAYGGYKAYQRYFGKAAKKCRGKSGAEKTLCLQQNVRPSYASD